MSTPAPARRAAAGRGKGAIRTRTAQPALRRRKTTTDSPPGLNSVLGRLTEAAFQRSVVKSLRARGYVVWTFPIMKRTIAGVPDLTFFHPARPGRLYCWELKTERGRIRPEQAVALAHLATVPGVDARIVRPSQWRELSEAV